MRPATVVTVQALMGRSELLVSLSAPAAANGAMPSIITLDANSLPPLTDAASIRAYGVALRDAISGHPAILGALVGLDGGVPTDGSLLFELLAPSAEAIRWETMVMNPGGFFAVDSPTPVGRIAGQAQRDELVRSLKWPLTIAAFISAAGANGEEELDALTTEISAARSQGLDVQLDVYLGEQDLLDKTRAAKADGVTAMPIPADPDALLKAITDRPAEIVHFFCHGIATADQQALELATIVDHATESLAGSLAVAIWQLSNHPTLKARAWLIVLNCCESSAVQSSTGSMAYRLVSGGGVPACVGMSEPIEVKDAHLVTSRFYNRLMADLAPLANAKGSHFVDFCDAVGAPRRALRSRHKAQANTPLAARWSLPALYTTGAPLKIQFDEDLSADQRIRLKTVAEFLSRQPADTPLGVRTGALKLLDDIPDAMRPDPFGRFGAEALAAAGGG